MRITKINALPEMFSDPLDIRREQKARNEFAVGSD